MWCSHMPPSRLLKQLKIVPKLWYHWLYLFGTHDCHWHCINCDNYSSVCLLVLQTKDWRRFILKINLNYALETMHWLTLVCCTNWLIRLQTGVQWLFLAQFEVSKDPKRPDMSSFVARGLQNCPSSNKKKIFFFLEGGNTQRLQGCRFNYWLH